MSPVVAQPGYAEWTVEQVYQALGTVRLVDVREPHELVSELGHIRGVEPAPLATLAQASQSWDRAKPVVLICRSGARSGRAAAALVAAGFSAPINMAGGMIAWNRAGLPVPLGQQAR